MIRSPCPKCREPALPGVTRCPHCSYRPMPWEIRRAKQIAAAKLLLAALFVGVLIYVIKHQ